MKNKYQYYKDSEGHVGLWKMRTQFLNKGPDAEGSESKAIPWDGVMFCFALHVTEEPLVESNPTREEDGDTFEVLKDLPEGWSEATEKEYLKYQEDLNEEVTDLEFV